jgi:hypothetical protein
LSEFEEIEMKKSANRKTSSLLFTFIFHFTQIIIALFFFNSKKVVSSKDLVAPPSDIIKKSSSSDKKAQTANISAQKGVGLGDQNNAKRRRRNTNLNENSLIALNSAKNTPLIDNIMNGM